MRADVVIAGAGLIGMCCALECSRRGLRVMLLEKGRAGQESSWAAAGMLAAHDPANPPELQELAELSLALYPAFLQQVAEDGDHAVPFETVWTLQEDDAAPTRRVPAGLSSRCFQLLAEQSLDPRKLTAAVAAAVRARSITLLEDESLLAVQARHPEDIQVHSSRRTLHCSAFLDCTGAWSGTHVRPAKGQMLRLHAPGALNTEELGNVVVRTHQVYLVPRLDGSVVVGATVEDAGFDKTLHDEDLDSLRTAAGELLPVLQNAPVLERWAGLRPVTVDELPLLGRAGGETARAFVAAGHYRNGVLLAPATAHVMAQLILGETPSVDLDAFAPGRNALKAAATKVSYSQDAVIARL